MRTFKAIVVALLASLIGTVASCSTMGGGGGMRYLVDPPSFAAEAIEA
jgi:hypothetical protein